uniref:Uncharacterized protein n=1 Tax=Octopus bimaculoides TaxID=37653 RepID=A0A0L8FY18_OCTBM
MMNNSNRPSDHLQICCCCLRFISYNSSDNPLSYRYFSQTKQIYYAIDPALLTEIFVKFVINKFSH